jgi:hypothetical protein
MAVGANHACWPRGLRWAEPSARRADTTRKRRTAVSYADLGVSEVRIIEVLLIRAFPLHVGRPESLTAEVAEDAEVTVVGATIDHSARKAGEWARSKGSERHWRVCLRRTGPTDRKGTLAAGHQWRRVCGPDLLCQERAM